MKQIRFVPLMTKLVLFLILLSPVVVGATTYYVANSGSDSNNGTSTFTPWQTIAHVNAQNFNPGDSILFQSGGIWREQLTVHSCGGSGNPITFGAYGSGAQPTISGSTIVSSWTQYSGNVWRANLTTQPTQVFFNGTRGAVETSVDSLTVPEEWYWASNILYVYATSNPSKVYTSLGVEADVRQWGIYSSNKSYVTIQNLTVQNTTTAGAGVGIFATLSNTIYSITVQNVASNGNGWDGFIVEGDNTGIANNVQFINCTANLNGRAGYHVYKVQGDSTNGIIYRNCQSTYAGQLQAHHGFSSQYAAYVKRYNCQASYTNIDPGTGLANVYYDSNGEGHGLVFDDFTNNSLNYGCYSHHNAGVGIQAVNSGSNDTTEYCISALNGGAGILIDGNTGSSNVYLYNNTVVGNGIYQVNGGSSGILIYPTITDTSIYIKNNIATDNYEFGIDGAYADQKVAVDHNLTNGNGLGDTQWVVATNSVTAAPLFVHGGDSNFILQPGSSAIWAGVNVGLSVDYVGNQVHNPPSMGAYEYMEIAPACIYYISPASQAFVAGGGTGSVSVTTQRGCSWTAASAASWMSITSGGSGTGSGTVGYSIAANTATSSRTVASTVAGLLFTLTQAGVTAHKITASAGTGGPSLRQVLCW